MTTLDHKHNALLAMDYFIEKQSELIRECEKSGFDQQSIINQQNMVHEMRASRKFIEESK